jgi:putative ABC transport system permease protein
MNQPVQPMYISCAPDSPYDRIRYLLVRIRPKDIPTTLAFLERQWQEFAPGIPFEFSFLDETFNTQFRGVEKIRIIFSYFSLLAICIASLGLLGLAAFAAEQRRREVSIRKVLGASDRLIMWLFSREYFALFCLATVIACPLIYFSMDHWLRLFPYHAPLNWPLFLWPATGVFLLGLAVISTQTLRAARVNPAVTLKQK